MISKLAKDEAGILTFEWILLLTILVVGVIAGLASVRDSLNGELTDVAQGIGAIDQSYTYSGAKYEISQGVGAQGNTFFDVSWIEGSEVNESDIEVDFTSLPAGDSDYVEADVEGKN